MSQNQYHSQQTRRSSTRYNDEDQTSRTLFVRINKSQPPNDVSAITNKNFRRHFQEFEEDIEKATVIFHHDTKLPRGFGFVTFVSRDFASEAMEYFQGTMLSGKHRLDISFKLPPKQANPSAPYSKPRVREKPVPEISNKKNDTIVEFKDEVIGLLMMEGDSQSLKEVAGRQKVELCPLRAPRVGFQIKGESKGLKVVIDYCDRLRIAKERNSIGYEQIILNASCQPVYDSDQVEQCRKSMKGDLKVVTACTFQGCVFYQVGVRVAQNHVIFVRIIVGDLSNEQSDAIVIPTGRAVHTRHSYPIELPSLPLCGNLRSLNNPGTEPLVEVGQTGSLDGGELPCSYIIQALFPLAVQKSSDNEINDLVIRNSLSLAMQMNLGSIAFPGIKTQMISSIVNSLCSLGPTSLHTVTVVMGTKFEAKQYEAALRSITSSSAGLETEKSFAGAVGSTATHSGGSSSGFIWSWREDDGSFIPYTPAATEALNKSYQQDSNGFCQLSINGVRYIVYFTAMQQVNPSTQKLRDVNKSVRPTEGVPTQHSVSSQARVQWKWRDDSRHFASYSHTNSAQIEAMFQRQDESGHIVIQKKTYRFDFNRMKQVNILTGFTRDVQRVASTSDDPVVGSKPVFLSDDEVVINLKGPRENLAVAKKQLEQKIRAMMFTKMIPLPTKLTPSLHQHLQAIAKKNRISCTAGEDTAGEASNVFQRVLKLEGLETHVKDALMEVQGLILQFQATSEHLAARSTVEGGSQCPKEWDPMSEKDLVRIVHLPMLAECQWVSKKFQETMPDAHVIKVQRVQNKELWSRYMQCMRRMHEKNAGKVNEKHLFHGTRGEPAEKICRSEEGFDMRFSREGMWGQANYFAANASYSDTYSHQNSAISTREMILANVLTGDSYVSARDSTLRMPPEKHQHSIGDNQLQQVRYDSVKGETSGSVVYMTYSNDRAYPAYIITYSRTQPAGHSRYYPAAYAQPPSASYNVPSPLAQSPAVPPPRSRAPLPPRSQAPPPPRSQAPPPPRSQAPPPPRSQAPPPPQSRAPPPPQASPEASAREPPQPPPQAPPPTLTSAAKQAAAALAFRVSHMKESSSSTRDSKEKCTIS